MVIANLTLNRDAIGGIDMSGSCGVGWKLKDENGGIGSKAEVKTQFKQNSPNTRIAGKVMVNRCLT